MEFQSRLESFMWTLKEAACLFKLARFPRGICLTLMVGLLKTPWLLSWKQHAENSIRLLKVVWILKKKVKKEHRCRITIDADDFVGKKVENVNLPKFYIPREPTMANVIWKSFKDWFLRKQRTGATFKVTGMVELIKFSYLQSI